MTVTISDARDRAAVRLVHRGWTGVLLFVDDRRARGKVILPSGDVVFVPLDQLIRADAPHTSSYGGADAAGCEAGHDPQAV